MEPEMMRSWKERSLNSLCQTRVLDLVVNSPGIGIRNVGVVMGTAGVLFVVELLESLEALHLGVVEISSKGDQNRRR